MNKKNLLILIVFILCILPYNVTASKYKLSVQKSVIKTIWTLGYAHQCQDGTTINLESPIEIEIDPTALVKDTKKNIDITKVEIVNKKNFDIKKNDKKGNAKNLETTNNECGKLSEVSRPGEYQNVK